MMKRIPSLAISLLLLLTLLWTAGCGQKAQEGPVPMQLESKSGDTISELLITPGQVGPNQFVVSITSPDGQPLREGKATLHFSMEGMEHGKSEEELKPQTDGKWVGEGPHIMMTGAWKVELEYVSPSGEKKLFSYSFQVKE